MIVTWKIFEVFEFWKFSFLCSKISASKNQEMNIYRNIKNFYFDSICSSFHFPLGYKPLSSILSSLIYDTQISFKFLDCDHGKLLGLVTVSINIFLFDASHFSTDIFLQYLSHILWSLFEEIFQSSTEWCFLLCFWHHYFSKWVTAQHTGSTRSRTYCKYT